MFNDLFNFDILHFVRVNFDANNALLIVFSLAVAIPTRSKLDCQMKCNLRIQSVG